MCWYEQCSIECSLHSQCPVSILFDHSRPISTSWKIAPWLVEPSSSIGLKTGSGTAGLMLCARASKASCNLKKVYIQSTLIGSYVALGRSSMYRNIKQRWLSSWQSLRYALGQAPIAHKVVSFSFVMLDSGILIVGYNRPLAFCLARRAFSIARSSAADSFSASSSNIVPWRLRKV